MVKVGQVSKRDTSDYTIEVLYDDLDNIVTANKAYCLVGATVPKVGAMVAVVSDNGISICIGEIKG